MNFPPKPNRKSSAHEWQDYLRDSEGLGTILAKTEDLVNLKISLQAALVELDLGHLAPKIEVGWRSGTPKEHRWARLRSRPLPILEQVAGDYCRRRPRSRPGPRYHAAKLRVPRRRHRGIRRV